MSSNPDDPTQIDHRDNALDATGAHHAFPGLTSSGFASPQNIGPYKLQQRIGAGGMGEVWAAEQAEPVKRRVALKLIKQGIGSKELIARFDAERQALALMNHPNIARILDAGTTPDGQPYFAMELVQGKPLTTYCDENRLSIEERLGLFADVCSGVQHAHQKGIIHRDLKPGNILVTVADGKAVPKVIDFGLAKAMESNQRLTDQSLFTGIGQILGTLKYMSPEQASLDSIDIDTRTDIYALGVILYELLTGTTPLDDSSVKDQAALKVLEVIRDKEPAKPSSKLGSSTDDQVSIITNKRKTDGTRLNRVLTGDLDWIVMKALEKDRTRRYESASGFAADVRRYLNSEPVVARPPSLNYRVQKFVRKHRAGVIAASLVLTALIGGIILTSAAMFRALKAESLAEEQSLEADKARDQEKQQRAIAERKQQEAEQAQRQAELAAEKERLARLDEERERKFAEAISQFVKDDFLALTSRDGQDRFGGWGMDRNITAYELLERAAKKLRERTDLSPLVEAELCWIIGVNYRGSGEAAKGIPFLERSVELRNSHLAPDHPETINSMNSLALGYLDAGQLDKALPMLEQTVELFKSQLGPDHQSTLNSMNSLALGYLDSSQLEKALPMLEQNLELTKAKLGLDHQSTLNSMNSLALGYLQAGQLDKALPMLEHNLELMKAKWGVDHENTLLSMNNLASGYRAAGQLDRALPLFEQVLEPTKARLGPGHPHTLASMNNLALGYRGAGQLDKALPLFEKTLELLKAKLGPDHPDTIECMNNLALVYRDSGHVDRALPLLESLLESQKAKLGPDHPDTFRSVNNLASAYRSAKRLDLSIPLYEELLKLSTSKLGRSHPNTQLIVANLGVNYKDAGRVDEAIPLLEEGYQSSKQMQQLAKVKQPLRDAYIQARRLEKFAKLADEELNEARASLPPASAELATLLVSLGKDFLTIGDYQRASELLEEGLNIRQQVAPDLWNTFNTQSLLGESLLAQARGSADDGNSDSEHKGDVEVKARLHAQAELLLLAGYKGMKQRESNTPPEAATSILEALDRLVELYTALDKQEDVAKYRELRSAYPPPSPPLKNNK